MRSKLPPVAAVVLFIALRPLTVNAESLTSSSNPSFVGQEVTFTAAFSEGCADGVSNASFSIDGGDAGYTTFSGNGQSFIATLTTSALSAGDHEIVFTWSTTSVGGQSCGSSMSLTQTVGNPPPPPTSQPAESPSPQPVESAPPSPAESPSAAASPTGLASAARLAAMPDPKPSFSVGIAALGGAVIAAGAAMVFLRLRSAR